MNNFVAAHPDRPQNLELLSETWQSIELQWTAGFDGGYQQEFFIVVTIPSTQQEPLFRSTGSLAIFNVTGTSPSNLATCALIH